MYVSKNACKNSKLTCLEFIFLSSEVCKDFITTFVDFTQLLKDLHYC